MSISKKDIINTLPYGKEFCFVDSIDYIDTEQINGSYFFAESSPYLKHHFIDNPVVPGVMLLECIVQIGLVAHGIFLLNLKEKKFFSALSHITIEYLEAVKPDTTVQVVSRKIYLRANILKSEIRLYNNNNNALIAYCTASCKFVL